MTTSFHLINEFRELGPRSLSQLLCASRLTVVWGPVYPLLLEAYKNGHSLMSPEFFLDLLERENSPIRIVAREKWLRDKSYRNKYAKKHWYSAGWRDRFDTRIEEVLDDDLKSNRPAESRRVVIAPRDPGWRKAEDILSRCENQTKLELEEIAQKSELLPPGIAQRIESFKDEHHPVETVLRDVYNHDIARKEFGADTSFLDSVYLSFVRRVSKAGVEVFLPHPGFKQGEGLQIKEALEALDLLQPLSTTDAFEDWFSEDRTDDRQKLLRLFETRHEVTIGEELLRRLLFAGHALDNTVLQELFPEFNARDNLTKAIELGQVVQAIWLLFTSAALEPTALLKTPLRLLSRQGRRRGWRLFPVTSVIDLDETGTLPVFQLVFGTARPSEPQFRMFVKALKRELQRSENDT